MSDQPEPLAAILAEFRAFALRAAEEDKMISPESVLLLVDKVEAAAEQERNAHTNDIHDALYKATGIPGNAAAMRDALEQALAYCESDQKSGIAYSDNDVLVPMLRAALSAPARNCDRFANELDARLAWKREVHCKGDYRYWLFAPEGGEE